MCDCNKVFASLLEYATVGYLGKRIAMRKSRAQQQAQAAAKEKEEKENKDKKQDEDAKSQNQVRVKTLPKLSQSLAREHLKVAPRFSGDVIEDVHIRIYVIALTEHSFLVVLLERN